MRSILCISVVLFIWLASGSNRLDAQSSEITRPFQAAEFRQFDFWIGTWDVNLRKLQPDLTWRDDIQAQAHIHSILDGKAILELWDSTSIKGFSLRYFDSAHQKWILYLNWPGPKGAQTSRLEGQFRHGRGEFSVQRPLPNGEAMISRFTFSDIAVDRLRWDDAYSRDGGKTWAANWIMEFSRSGKQANWPANGNHAHTFDAGERCAGEAFDLLAKLAGTWRGTTADDEDSQVGRTISLRAYRILDGCAVIRFLDSEADGEVYREFGLLTYNQDAQEFEELVLTNEPDQPARLFRGQQQKGVIEMKEVRTKDQTQAPAFVRWTIPESREDSLRLHAVGIQAIDGDPIEIDVRLRKKDTR